MTEEHLADAPDADSGPERVIGESRWPMAIAVIVLMVATVVAPGRGIAGLVWVIAGLEGVVLLALILGDPGKIDRRSRWLRRLGLLLIAIVLGVALASTAVLVYDLVTGSEVTKQPAALLIVGAKVWLTNCIAFALLYWQLDGGGPAQRAHGLPRYPDFAFPQLANPDLAPPDWRPQFVDYLYLSLTTANAFSPTDTPPMVGWAKLAMATQAIVSFVIVGLVIARAVNVFT
jgi:uncharacterized membrane protein